MNPVKEGKVKSQGPKNCFTDHCIGLKRKAPQWFGYLCNRTVMVNTDGIVSNVAPLSHGVPQGSIPGPLLFSLYLLPLGQIFRTLC